MDAFWIIKVIYHFLVHKTVVRYQQDNTIFFNFVLSIDKECKKKGLNPKMRTERNRKIPKD